jgi:ribonuclease HII
MKSQTKNTQWIAGIDEVGRGPLAGPITVCAFAVPVAYWKKFQTYTKRHGLTDSKKLTAQKRMEWHKFFQSEMKKGHCMSAIVSSSSKQIDQVGLSVVVKKLIARALGKLSLDPTQTCIKLDGSLYAPESFTDQETIIRGDSKHMVIAAASVIAKVTRDRYMTKQARIYPQYGFEVHKGYGTKKHCAAIRKHGYTPLHRITFCTRIKPSTRRKIDIA